MQRFLKNGKKRNSEIKRFRNTPLAQVAEKTISIVTSVYIPQNIMRVWIVPSADFEISCPQKPCDVWQENILVSNMCYFQVLLQWDRWYPADAATSNMLSMHLHLQCVFTESKPGSNKQNFKTIVSNILLGSK